VKELNPKWLKSTAKVGIRPQLVNWKTKELVMDFIIEQDEHSLHVLNAISPAFTSSLSFANYIVNQKLSQRI
jgi:L-2-hydroxyglutarate oxidase LhgO